MTFEPEGILDGWRIWDTLPWTRPEIVRELAGGRSNRSFLLDAGGAAMVLRVNATQRTIADIERRHEAGVWRAASTAGIAPPLLHAAPDGGFLVSAYIESDLPARPQDDPAVVAMAIELLQRCHRLNVEAPAIDYSAHVETYWQQIEVHRIPVEPGLLEQREPMRNLLRELLASDSPKVLCHHDPVVENFVGSRRRLYLIDWEYAVLGLVVMDYAALAVEWEVGAETLAGHTGIEATSLTKAMTLYRYLCELWSAAASVD